MTFLKQFLKNSKEIGAVAPSSKGLSKLITNRAHLSTKKCVVELGSGTGVFTQEILHQISPECVFFCLEINQKFVTEAQIKYPRAIVYHSSAKNIQKYLLRHKQNSCDCIISGLPWAAFDQRMQVELLDSAYNSLEDGGIFLTFAYLQGALLPKGIRFKELLNNKFKHVEKTRIIWKNLPPAFVYLCRK